MKPVYEMAVMNVRMKFPNSQDARMISGDLRFRETLRAILWEQQSYMVQGSEMAEHKKYFEENWETMWKPQFIPDLWWIDKEADTIHLFEIEDTHPLTQDKLALVHNYWWDMDAISWKVELTVFDRYGLNPRSLDLTQYAYHILAVQNRENKPRRPSR